MADLLYSPNGKLNALNRKIIQVKKKIQLSEGQRKANFEECDAKKRESTETISKLKREVKELQTEFAKTKNNEEVFEKAASLNRECAAFVGKRSLNDALTDLDEHNIRLRKKLDLAKYQSDKRQKQLQQLLREYEELMDIKPTQIEASKISSRLIKKVPKLF
uniref:Uncharacterized protein n=1 Tax=Trichogramma kaykai TaxID=54128 RepID=A0ABD2WV33_9HYME